MLTLAPSGRVIEIVITQEDWEDLVTIPWGDVSCAAREVGRWISTLPAHQHFLVYNGLYELVGSATEELPVDPEDERLDELLRQRPEVFDRRVVLDDQGNVVDEFRNHGE